MRYPSTLTSIILSSLALLSTLAQGSELQTAPAPAITQEETSTWKHEVMIYGWLGIPEAELTYTIPESDPAAGGEEVTTNVADSIDMVFMGTYRGQKDKFSVIIDAIYLGMSNDNDTDLFTSRRGLPDTNIKSEASIDAWMAAAYGGYNVVNSQLVRVDLIAGLRYAYLSAEEKITSSNDLNLRGITLSGSVDLWDAVVGIDGSVYINKQWYLPYHFDIGAGDSDLTWRASAGMGYRFDWGSVILSYRHLAYDVSDSRLIENIDFSGPLLGASFQF